MGGQNKRPDLRAKAVELSRQGLGIKVIAKMLGCSIKIPINARIEAGLPRTMARSKGRTGQTWKMEWTNSRVEKLMIATMVKEHAIVKAQDRLWARHPVCKEYQYNSNWRRQNKLRRATPEGRMLMAVRLRVWKVCKQQGESKRGRSMRLIGCSAEELRAHLSSRFKRGMTWGNYGRWEVDHIIRCSSFDLSSEQQQRQCFHFTNLQPLWKSVNRKKHATMPNNPQMSLIM